MRDRDGATDRSARTPVRARSVVWTVIAGALVGCGFGLAIAPPMGARFEARLPWTAALPAPGEWPRAARAGETARLEPGRQGRELVVTAGTATAARELLRALAAGATLSGIPARLSHARAQWLDSLASGPLPAPTTATARAAVLLARARWGRGLAAQLPVQPAIDDTQEAIPPIEVLASWEDVTRIAATAEPGALAHSIELADELELDWFTDDHEWQGWSTAARTEAWRFAQVDRADGLEDRAEQLLTGQSAAQRDLADDLALVWRVELDRKLRDPWSGQAQAQELPALRPLVRPIASAWLPPMAVGAGAGSLLAVLALLLGSLRSPRVARVRPMRSGGADPAAEGPRLHVVGGGTPAAVTRAALELAARRVALGERVLLVDGSARLRLHERLDRDARWGLLECLAADMPMLGLVQYAGHPGLYLLPHGNAERLVGWSPLGRKLDEVMPHFGRIVLALDPQSPSALGDALRGRAMEGWWADSDGRAQKGADAATARFGIVFHRLDLSGFMYPTLEGLGERVRELRPSGPAPEPAPITARAVLKPVPATRPALEPIVLDCDLQVRQRLRFLAWMRRVQAANRRAELQALV
ncbi:MAG: hypothetical protein ABL977_07815 [Candidatus Eisenbacteria bacterium]